MLDYQFEQLWESPPAMGPWQLRIDNPQPTEYGHYAVVEIEQAGIETHHEVQVIDESGFPLRGVWVIFGFPGGGPDINLPTRINRWYDGPKVLKGNAVKVPTSGYARHTFADGGEDIWIWDLDENNDLLLPSAIVRNCTWQRTPIAHFEHTGVRITFQRQKVGVVPLERRIRELEEVVGFRNDAETEEAA